MESLGNYRMFADVPEPTSEDIIEQFPAVPLALVEALERLYPDCLPETHITMGTLDRKIGQQDVIKTLRQVAGRRS